VMSVLLTLPAASVLTTCAWAVLPLALVTGSTCGAVRERVRGGEASAVMSACSLVSHSHISPSCLPAEPTDSPARRA
jgi:hypothetical protein